MTIEIGTSIPTWRVDGVDAEKMKTMAVLLRDPNPIHWDTDVVRELGMGDRPINQGPNNVGYVTNMLIAWLGDPGAIRSFRVRFRGNVFAGDVLEAGGEVAAITDAAGRRLATCEVWLDRASDGTRVLKGTAEVALPGVA